MQDLHLDPNFTVEGNGFVFSAHDDNNIDYIVNVSFDDLSAWLELPSHFIGSSWQDNKDQMHESSQQIVDRYQKGATSYDVEVKPRVLNVVDQIDYKANYKGYELKQIEAQKTEILQNGVVVLTIGGNLLIGELAVDELIDKKQQRYKDVFDEEHGETMHYTEEEKDLIQKHNQ